MLEYIESYGSAQSCFKTSCKWEAYSYLRRTVRYRTVSTFPCKRSLNRHRCCKEESGAVTDVKDGKVPSKVLSRRQA